MAGSLKSNLEKINKQIALELQKNPTLEQPRIIAVSKKQPVAKIEELYALGVADFAENYVQEAKTKMQSLKNLPLRWHYIGAVQSNKLNDLVGNYELIHSMARRTDVRKAADIADAKGVQQNFLIQINIAGEPTKQGVLPDDLPSILKDVQDFSNLHLQGFMIFPPLCETDEESLEWFAKGRELFEYWQKQLGASFQRLSMGTSSDFQLAVRMGATDLRIGESLLGQRSPQ